MKNFFLYFLVTTFFLISCSNGDDSNSNSTFFKFKLDGAPIEFYDFTFAEFSELNFFSTSGNNPSDSISIYVFRDVVGNESLLEFVYIGENKLLRCGGGNCNNFVFSLSRNDLGRISGTFSGTLTNYRNSSEVFTISNGAFDLKY